MARAAGDDHGLGRAVARADHEIVGVEIEELDRGRKERQVTAIVRGGGGEPLHERPPLRQPLQSRRHRPGDVQQCMQRRSGIQFRDRLEDFLAAAHAGQPVVDECDSSMADARGAMSVTHRPSNIGHRCVHCITSS